MNRNQWIGAGLVAGGALFLFSSSGASEPIPVVGNVTAKYDSIYTRQCPKIPVEYLRALAYRESRSNPQQSSGGAWGLLQVTMSVLDSYNERFGTSYTSNDRLNPEVNAQVACELIQRVAAMWSSSKYSSAFPGGFSWSDQRHVNLLTFAWNAGWSESRGVSGVILHLINQGRSPSAITIDTVRSAAESLSWASEYISRSDKVTWCKTVTALYFQQLRRPAT